MGVSSTQPADLQPLTGRPSFGQYLSDLRNRSDFIVTMPRHDVKAQNAGTFLGNIWLLANPLLTTAIYFLIFGLLLEVDRGVDNFLVFLIIGVLFFGLFSGAATGGSKVIKKNQALVRSIQFPRAALPIAHALAELYAFLPGLIVICLVALVTGEVPNAQWLALPVIVAVLWVFVCGVSLICARGGHAMPDLPAVLPHIVRLGFYSSGTLYEPSRFTEDERVLAFFDINPMYQFLTLARWSVSEHEVNSWFFVTAPLWAFATFAFGFVFFWRADHTYGAER